MDTKELYKMAMDHTDVDVDVTINLKSLAQLVWYAEGLGVKQICDRHSAIIADCHKKAAALRYHHMAAKILPEAIIYDGRYGDADEFADWGVRMAVSGKEVAQ
ncbi:MAG: hypothetical protein MUC33_01250 [Desulfobacterales bacterium]|jgi:hypothetical protein|nr:hypothetical protein [Desulfobacterales bacterium]MCU0601269.1 hypothetical protein [Desulfobacterales bacterium]